MLSTAPPSARRCCPRRLRPLARLAAPGEQLLRRQAMPARDLGHRRSGNQRLFKNLRPVVSAPTPPACRPGDHLEAAHLKLFEK